jgi:hypothetical protein
MSSYISALAASSELIWTAVDWNNPGLGYPCRDRQHAREVMRNFIATLRETARFPSIRPQLRTQHGYMEDRLAEGYTVAQWRNDDEVNRDEQRFLRLRATIAYSLEDDLSADTISEVTLNGRAGFGLAATWLLDGICISLASREVWNRSLLQAEVTRVSADDTGVDQAELRHAAAPSHFVDHEDWLQRTQKTLLRTGADLIGQAPTLYPTV